MEKFVINYHTGVTDTVEVNDLDQAKELAKEGMAYTQEKVTIETEDRVVITTAHWYSITPEEDDQVLVTVGEGFYQTWTDELGE